MRAIVRESEWDVDARLAELGLARGQLLDIVKARVAAFAGCTDNDPPGSAGWESYRAGVRRARELLGPQGWKKDNTGGYATVINMERKVRLAMLNADDGAGMPELITQNRSKKGPNSERAASANRSFSQIPLFDDADVDSRTADPSDTDLDEYATWHLCVYIDPNTVRAELSLFGEFSQGFVTQCIEKIILVGKGDWDQVMQTPDAGDDDGSQDFDIQVNWK